MNIFSIVMLVICSMIIGLVTGRIVTKAEFGKMLVWLEYEGYLQRPNGEYDDDEEDIK